jgi:hypothetical protein
MATGHHPARLASRLNLACVRFLKSKEIHMGMPLFAANALFAPLQQLARSLARVFTLPSRHGQAIASRPGVAPERSASPAHSAPRRLRVVRILEGSAPRSAGRMVISGRMADVCAELERLAALEAAAG